MRFLAAMVAATLMAGTADAASEDGGLVSIGGVATLAIVPGVVDVEATPILHLVARHDELALPYLRGSVTAKRLGEAIPAGLVTASYPFDRGLWTRATPAELWLDLGSVPGARIPDAFRGKVQGLSVTFEGAPSRIEIQRVELLPRTLPSRLRVLASALRRPSAMPENAWLSALALFGGFGVALGSVLVALARLPRPLPSVVPRNALARFFRLLPSKVLQAIFVLWGLAACREAALSFGQTRARWESQGLLGNRDLTLLGAQEIHPDLPSIVRELERDAKDSDTVSVFDATGTGQIASRLRYLLFPRVVTAGGDGARRVYVPWSSLPAISQQARDEWVAATSLESVTQTLDIPGDGTFILGIDFVCDAPPDKVMAVRLYSTPRMQKINAVAHVRGSGHARFGAPPWLWGGMMLFELFPLDGRVHLAQSSKAPYIFGNATSPGMTHEADLVFSVTLTPDAYEPELVLPDAAVLRRMPGR